MEGLVVNWGEVMARSFMEMDAELLGTGGMPAWSVGSTAVLAVVGREVVVVVANWGDSRAVMSQGGSAIALSEEHKVCFWIYHMVQSLFTSMFSLVD